MSYFRWGNSEIYAYMGISRMAASRRAAKNSQGIMDFALIVEAIYMEENDEASYLEAKEAKINGDYSFFKCYKSLGEDGKRDLRKAVQFFLRDVEKKFPQAKRIMPGKGSRERVQEIKTGGEPK